MLGYGAVHSTDSGTAVKSLGLAVQVLRCCCRICVNCHLEGSSILWHDVHTTPALVEDGHVVGMQHQRSLTARARHRRLPLSQHHRRDADVVCSRQTKVLRVSPASIASLGNLLQGRREMLQRTARLAAVDQVVEEERRDGSGHGAQGHALGARLQPHLLVVRQNPLRFLPARRNLVPYSSSP